MHVGCGTDDLTNFVKQVWPRLPIFGIDMSEAYVKYAKGYLKYWSQIRLSVGKAEALPVPTKAKTRHKHIRVHESPPKIDVDVFRECAPVPKPGGRFVLVDLLQHGDQPHYDGLLDVFPESYHEPYYRSYLDEDFGAIAESCGLAHVVMSMLSSQKSWCLTKWPDEPYGKCALTAKAAASSPRGTNDD